MARDEVIIEIKELPLHYMFIVFDGITKKSIGILKTELKEELIKTKWKDKTKKVKEIVGEDILEETDVEPESEPIPEPTEESIMKQYAKAKTQAEKIDVLAKALGIKV